MTIKVDTKGLKGKLTKLENLKDKIMPKALDYFKSQTPKRSGNARGRTRLDSSKTIQANYAYAERLDQGSSKQSPQGMTKPTGKYIQQLVSNYVKRLGV